MSRVIKQVSCLLLVMSSVLAQAQTALTKAEVSAKAAKDFETGITAARKGDDKYAIRYFEAALEKEPNFSEALMELAAVFYNRGEYSSAEIFLERAASLAGKPGIEAHYGLAMAEIKLNKYAEAVEHLDVYLAKAQPREDRKLAAEKFRDNAAFQAKALARPVDFQLKALPPTINTVESSEYLPSLTADGQTLVFTRRVNNRQEDFYSSIKINGEWQQAVPLPGVNTPDNEGAQSVSADGKLIVFTGCDKKDGFGSCDLYYSALVDGLWTPAANLGAPINTAAWESQPSLAANGNLLFFSSRRPGGHGGADLYASGRTPEGGWTEPMNLGPRINTSEDDQAPFFHADGVTLYFMSKGRPGMGGFDLYFSKLGADNIWGEPENLGHPLNTSGNEGALMVALDGKTAFYASDARTATEDMIGVGGGSGGSTDLYTFTLPPHARAGVVTYLRAKVIDAVTELPVAASALISDVATDQAFVKRRASADEGVFLVVLPSGKTYALSVEEPGYAFYSDRFELEEAASAQEPYELTIRLQPLRNGAGDEPQKPTEGSPIVLRNVLFSTGSDELLPASRMELDRLYNMLQDNPNLQIRLQGHTDDVGDVEANLQLSERRAAAVKNYLVEKGIQAQRLKSIGFGESRPLLPNTDAESRRLNRRTEFVVL